MYEIFFLIVFTVFFLSEIFDTFSLYTPAFLKPMSLIMLVFVSDVTMKMCAHAHVDNSAYVPVVNSVEERDDGIVPIDKCVT